MKNKIVKRMGFLKDQQGIMNRYLREMEGWNYHINRTKQFILKRLKTKDYQNIAFLGSGWLLDIPVDELIAKDKTIHLYDVSHPKQIKHKYRKAANMHFHEVDVTGNLIERYYEICKKSSEENLPLQLITATKEAKFPGIEADIVVSLNILDQLDGLLIDFLKKRMNQPETYWIELRKQIQANHLQLLDQCHSLLITDLEEIISDKQEEAVNPLIHVKIPAGKYHERWTWEFDSAGLYHKNKKTAFNVIALDL